MASAAAQKHSANPLTIIQRVAINDRTAFAECIDVYGNLIWALARNATDSTDEAENAVREIFIDIWRFAGRFEIAGLDERIFIMTIARRSLLNFLKKV